MQNTLKLEQFYVRFYVISGGMHSEGFDEHLEGILDGCLPTRYDPVAGPIK